MPKKFKVFRVANITATNVSDSVFFEVFEVSHDNGNERLKRIPELNFPTKAEAEFWIENNQD